MLGRGSRTARPVKRNAECSSLRCNVRPLSAPSRGLSCATARRVYFPRTSIFQRSNGLPWRIVGLFGNLAPPPIWWPLSALGFWLLTPKQRTAHYSPSRSPRVKFGGSLAGKDSSRDSSTSSSRCRSLSANSSSGRFALIVLNQLILILSSCKNHAQQLDDRVISG